MRFHHRQSRHPRHALGHRANPGLPPPMPRVMLDMFPVRVLQSGRLRGGKPVADRDGKPRLVVLDRQRVIGAAGHNGVSNLVLRPHGVDRNRRGCHAVKQRSDKVGFSAANTRRKASDEGMPLAYGRMSRSHANWPRPYKLIVSQSSTPHSQALNARSRNRIKGVAASAPAWIAQVGEGLQCSLSKIESELRLLPW